MAWRKRYGREVDGPILIRLVSGFRYRCGVPSKPRNMNPPPLPRALTPGTTLGPYAIVPQLESGARMFHRKFPAWDGLHHSVLTGEPGFNKVFGQPLLDYIGTNPELAPIFDAGITAIHGYDTAAMVKAYDFGRVGVLAEIGDGNGSCRTATYGPMDHPRRRGHSVPDGGRDEAVAPLGETGCFERPGPSRGRGIA